MAARLAEILLRANLITRQQLDQAIAQQKVEAAKGERDANVARAQGDAQANRLRQKSLTKMLVQWEAIQKLNPNVSVIICPPNSVCVPNAGVVPQPSNGG